MAQPPVVGHRIIEALLDSESGRVLQPDRPAALVLVHGRYDTAAPAEFTARIGAEQRRVRVSDQPSVLGVLDAWKAHRARADPAILVITTGVDDRRLGADLRGHALRRRSLSVDRAEIVKQRFGAADLDPRIRHEGWLVEALLEAEPGDGGWRGAQASAAWRRGGGTVLTRDAAVQALIEARLRIFELTGHQTLDSDTLLAWSRTASGPASFAALAAEERDGLTGWLRETVGDAAYVLLGLVAAGRGGDAMAVGAVAAVLTDPAAPADALFTVGGLLGDVTVGSEQLRAFTTAVQGTLTRWITEAETGRDEARLRVLAVLERADRLAADARLGPALAADPFLPSALRSRLHRLAAALGESTAAAAHALAQLTDHRLAGLHADRCAVAEAALRLRRWLDTPVEEITSVASGVRQHLNSLGWADRALNLLWTGDPEGDPIVEHAYQRLYESARARRDELDHAFADRLREWAAGAAARSPGGCLLVEEVLAQVAVPLTAGRAPLVLVLDGMSSAVATQLGEQLLRRGWAEVSAAPRARRAAVSMIPSVTTVSRASLLSGTPVSGGQAVETDGFAAFWRRHHRQGVLFHKSAIAGHAGHRLAGPLMDALFGDQVVGVVLNTVDDALDRGREGARAGWHLADVAHLLDLLNAAQGAGRPVVLVSDHGHVLDRGSGDGPAAVPGGSAARWRTGSAVDGEVELAGPRVLDGGGRVVVPWRETIRYTPRKAGYHGGASLAEMTVPVLVVLPAGEAPPAGWSVLAPEDAAPSWWTGRTPVVARATEPAGLGAQTPVQVVPAGLGARIVGSPVYAGQSKYVRKAPDPAQVASVIDALALADGTLSPAAVGSAAAAAGGRAPRSTELFVTTLQRLLNVEGYPVLGLVDAGRTVKLDVALLREQFGVSA
jgi:PglZ domain